MHMNEYYSKKIAVLTSDPCILMNGILLYEFQVMVVYA